MFDKLPSREYKHNPTMNLKRIRFVVLLFEIVNNLQIPRLIEGSSAWVDIEYSFNTVYAISSLSKN